MSNHGPRFDEFHAQSGSPHNGAQHDSFHEQRADQLPHGALVDAEFRAADPTTPGGRGERWDDFAWREMPIIHGAHYDSDFEQPAVLDGVEHGTWYDVFRGGAQVKAIVDGKDVEAVVIDCHADHVKLRQRDGSVAEAALSQLRAFRGPQPDRSGIRTAQVGHTDAPIVASTAEAPSAHSATASGGHLPTYKTLDEALEALDVLKSVDASETALQGAGDHKSVGHRTACPRGGSGPCGAEQGGKCSLCGAGVRDHAAVGKTTGPMADVLKTLGELA